MKKKRLFTSDCIVCMVIDQIRRLHYTVINMMIPHSAGGCQPLRTGNGERKKMQIDEEKK